MFELTVPPLSSGGEACKVARNGNHRPHDGYQVDQHGRTSASVRCARALFVRRLSPTLDRMEPTQNMLRKDATKAAALLQRLGRAMPIPFLGNFPTNSCEAASAILGTVSERRYSSVKVRVVAGYDRTANVSHYWVEVGEYVMDITAHQFPEHAVPIIALRPNPIEQRFPASEWLSPAAALLKFSTEDRTALILAAEELEKELAA